MSCILPLRNITLEDGGGKAFALSKISNKFNVSKGFVISTKVYDYYIKNNKLPENLSKEIEDVIKRENIRYPLIARSSATIEDSISHSFAGQFISIYPIYNLNELLKSIIKIYESTKTERVKRYMELMRIKNPIKMAVLVQEFIDTDYGGVAFSRNIYENKDEIIIEISKGLTANVVSGKAESNIYFISRGSLEISKVIERFNLDTLLLKEIARQVLDLENIFGYPIDVEFGVKGKIYIFQVRPITPKRRTNVEFKVPENWGYLEGIPTGTGKVFGISRVVKNDEDLKKLKPGEILVSKTTYDYWMPDMLKAIGIVNEIGNITSHSAIIAKEFGIPTVVNVRNALDLIKDGMPIFIDADEGRIYYPGKSFVRFLDILSDFTFDHIPLDIKSLKPVSLIDVIKNPKNIVLYEEYLRYKIVYFHPSVDKDLKEKVLEKLSAIEGHTDVHQFYIEWAYGFLIHDGLKEWLERGKRLLDNPEELDKYLYESMRISRNKMKNAYTIYRKAREENNLEMYLKAMDFIDASLKYFEIANSIFPLGYGIRKLRELAMQYGDYRIMLSKIEEYKGTKMYRLYEVLKKWKDKSDLMDVWEKRKILWNKIRKEIIKNLGLIQTNI